LRGWAGLLNGIGWLSRITKPEDKTMGHCILQLVIVLIVGLVAYYAITGLFALAEIVRILVAHLFWKGGKP
jgi:hypothetical protein